VALIAAIGRPLVASVGSSLAPIAGYQFILNAPSSVGASVTLHGRAAVWRRVTASGACRKSAIAQSRCALARCAGARTERPAVGRERTAIAWWQGQHDQQAYCWRATHDQEQQEDLRAISLIRRATKTAPVTQWQNCLDESASQFV
jgi:hypothetical protein